MARPRRPISYRLKRRTERGPFYICYQEAGQPKRKSTGCKKRANAEKVLQRFLAERERKSAWGTEDLRLGDACSNWMEDKRQGHHELDGSTLRSYQQVVDRLVQHLGAKKYVREIIPQDLQDHLAWLGRKHKASPVGVKKHLGIIRMIFGWMADFGHIAQNPSRPIKLKKVTAKRIEPLEEERFQELLVAVDEEISKAKLAPWKRNLEALRDWLSVLWYSGMRSVEPTRMTWEDVDLRKKTWWIRSPENKGGHHIAPIHTRILPLLKRRKLLGDPGPFPPRERLRTTWVRFRRRNEAVSDIHLHSLRHAFVTRLAAAGHQGAASYLVGHHSAQMTEHYTHLTPEDARKVLDQL